MEKESFYITSKIVKAEPCSKKEYFGKADLLGMAKELITDEKDEEGYLISNPNGTISWESKDDFEKKSVKVTPNSVLKTNISISQDTVDNFIKETHIETIGEKTTIVRVILNNGFEIVEASTCVDKENYDEKIGAQCCMEKIKDKIWAYLGFLLQTAYNN